MAFPPDPSLREMDLIILRHCEKSGEGLCDPLTEKGAADAVTLAKRLEGVHVQLGLPCRSLQRCRNRPQARL